MFGTIRDKFQSVQSGLSASIRGLSLAETSTKPKKVFKPRNVNYNAGADVLHHFQTEWNNLHELSEDNAQKAQEVDALITTIHDKIETQWNSFSSLDAALAEIPKLDSTLQALVDKIGSLEIMFEQVNNAILELEDLQETLDFQKDMVDERCKFELYKKEKLDEFNLIKEKLASEHAEKVLRHEQQQEKLLKERQNTFDEVFKEQLREYKETGSIPKSSSNAQKGLTLDDIVLDSDPADIDEFLKE